MNKEDEDFLLEADSSSLDWVDFKGNRMYGELVYFQDKLLIKLGQTDCGYMISYYAPIKTSLIAMNAGLPPLSNVFVLNKMKRCGWEESMGFNKITFEREYGIFITLSRAADGMMFKIPIYDEEITKLFRLEERLTNEHKKVMGM